MNFVRQKESPNLVQAVVSAFFSGYDMHWPQQGTVESVNDTTLSVRIGDEVIQDVVWHFPGTPSVGSKVMVLYHKNIESRVIAMGFSSFDKFDVVIAETMRLTATKDKISFGKQDKLEPAVLGTKLKIWLEGLIDQLLSNPLTIDSVTGPESASPALVTALQNKKAELTDILSEAVEHS